MKNRIIVFAGQYFDNETGLHYNYFRYYDPKLGRYLRSDPVGLVGGINLYSYSLNNPVILIDPYGLLSDPTGTFIGIGTQTSGSGWLGALGRIGGPVGAFLGVMWPSETAGPEDDMLPPGGPSGPGAGPAGGTASSGSSTASAPAGEGGGGSGSAGSGGGNRRCCKPCKPPVGTLAARVGSRGEHVHIYRMNQNPNNCRCFWSEVRQIHGTTTAPPGVGPVGPARGGGFR